MNGIPTAKPITACLHVGVHSKSRVDMASKLKLLDATLERLTDVLVSLGSPRYRAKQLWAAVLQQNITACEGVTTVSLKERAKLAHEFTLRSGSVVSESCSTDGTVKWLVELPRSNPFSSIEPTIPKHAGVAEDIMILDSLGQKPEAKAVKAPLRVETVYIPELSRALSGQLGASDILEQVLLARERLAALPGEAASSDQKSTHPPRPPLSHVVFMGQGEPLLTWPSVRTAIQAMTSQAGMGIPARRITVSTSGVAPFIPRVAKDTPGVRLALSLHAPTDELRSRIMGINKTWPIRAVMEGCAEYIKIRLGSCDKSVTDKVVGADAMHRAGPSTSRLQNVDPLQTSDKSLVHAQTDFDDGDEDDDENDDAAERHSASHAGRHNGSRRVRVTFEYVMLDSVNDSFHEARQLVDLLAHIPCPSRHAHVNLIPFNPWDGAPYGCSPPARIKSFQAILMNAGIRATVRKARGSDVLGACGQLRSSAMLKRKSQ